MSEVVPIRSTEQLSFEGTPIAQSVFSLVSGKRLYTPAKLEGNAHVKFRGSGRVKGIGFDYEQTKEGDAIKQLSRLHVVEVLGAVILEDPRCPKCGHVQSFD